MTDKEIIKALECCTNPKVGVECPREKFVDVCNDGCSHLLMTQALDLINRQQAEIDDLFLKLNGVMWSVDKWLDGDELKQDEVNRAITMREKTLQITEKQQAEIERLQNESVGKCELAISMRSDHNIDIDCNYCIEQAKAEAIKEFVERLKEKYIFGDFSNLNNLVKEMVGEQNEL